MNEKARQWHVAADPRPMLSFLALIHPISLTAPSAANDRQRRLFWCAVAADLLDRFPLDAGPEVARAIDRGYRMANGEVLGVQKLGDLIYFSSFTSPYPERKLAYQVAAMCVAEHPRVLFLQDDSWELTPCLSGPTGCALVREIFANPHAHAKLPLTWSCVECDWSAAEGEYDGNHACQSCGSLKAMIGRQTALQRILSWRGGLVNSMANDIYAGKKFDQLPILADAAE